MTSTVFTNFLSPALEMKYKHQTSNVEPIGYLNAQDYHKLEKYLGLVLNVRDMLPNKACFYPGLFCVSNLALSTLVRRSSSFLALAPAPPLSSSSHLPILLISRGGESTIPSQRKAQEKALLPPFLL